MNLKEAKDILLNQGYKVIKETFDYDKWLINGADPNGDKNFDRTIEIALDKSRIPTQKEINEFIPELKEEVPELISATIEKDTDPEIEYNEVKFKHKLTFLVKFNNIEDLENTPKIETIDETFYNFCVNNIWSNAEIISNDILDKTKAVLSFVYVLYETVVTDD